MPEKRIKTNNDIDKFFGPPGNGDKKISDILPGEDSVPPEHIMVFSRWGETLHVLWENGEIMFLVNDLEKMALFNDRQEAIQKAQGINSTIFITRKVNHEDFEDKPYLFTNLQGASAMTLSEYDDCMITGAFSYNEFCNFLDATIFKDNKYEA